MRTTINIDAHLLIEVKTLAAQSGRTIGEIIEEALRLAAERRRAAASVPIPALPVVEVGGLQPGVDLDDSAALLELMEGADR